MALQTDRSGGPDACWPWIGGLNSNGRPAIRVDGRKVGAHRVAAGAGPDDELVMHLCDNPPCVNPAHLRIGTSIENALDRDLKHRQPHKVTPDEVREIRRRRAAGESTNALAVEFGVGRDAIWRITSGRTWKHVA